MTFNQYSAFIVLHLINSAYVVSAEADDVINIIKPDSDGDQFTCNDGNGQCFAKLISNENNSTSFSSQCAENRDAIAYSPKISHTFTLDFKKLVHALSLTARKNVQILYGLQDLVGLQDLRFYADGSRTPNIWFNNDEVGANAPSCGAATLVGNPRLSHEKESRDMAFIICNTASLAKGCKLPGSGGKTRAKRKDSNEWLDLDKFCFNKEFEKMSSTDATSKCGQLGSQIASEEDLKDIKFPQNEVYAFKEGPPYRFWDKNRKMLSSSVESVTTKFIECPADNENYIICQTRSYTSRYYGCYEMTTTLDNVYKETSSHMSVSYCIAICHGQKANFAAVAQKSCYCCNDTDDLGIKNKSPEPSKCRTPCRGRHHQVCGSEGYISIFRADMYDVFSNGLCLSFFKLGFYPSTGKSVVFRNGNNSFINCSLQARDSITDTKCPKEYVKNKGRCFRFHRKNLQSNEAHKQCQIRGGDLATIQPEDTDFIHEFLRGSNELGQYNDWLVGLMVNDSKASWRNGDPVNEKTPNMTGTYCNSSFTLKKNGKIFKNIQPIPCNNSVSLPFICLYNPRFMGFENVDPYESTTVAEQQSNISHCVHFCTNRSSHMAVLRDECRCITMNSQHDTIPDTYSCKSEHLCSGNSGQICGCDGKSAIYKLAGVLNDNKTTSTKDHYSTDIVMDKSSSKSSTQNEGSFLYYIAENISEFISFANIQ